MYAIYGNIYHQYTPNVSIYTSTMDPMGLAISPGRRLVRPCAIVAEAPLQPGQTAFQVEAADPGRKQIRQW